MRFNFLILEDDSHWKNVMQKAVIDYNSSNPHINIIMASNCDYSKTEEKISTPSLTFYCISSYSEMQNPLISSFHIAFSLDQRVPKHTEGTPNDTLGEKAAKYFLDHNPLAFRGIYTNYPKSSIANTVGQWKFTYFEKSTFLPDAWASEFINATLDYIKSGIVSEASEIIPYPLSMILQQIDTAEKFEDKLPYYFRYFEALLMIYAVLLKATLDMFSLEIGRQSYRIDSSLNHVLKFLQEGVTTLESTREHQDAYPVKIWQKAMSAHFFDSAHQLRRYRNQYAHGLVAPEENFQDHQEKIEYLFADILLRSSILIVCPIVYDLKINFNRNRKFDVRGKKLVASPVGAKLLVENVNTECAIENGKSYMMFTDDADEGKHYFAELDPYFRLKGSAGRFEMWIKQTFDPSDNRFRDILSQNVMEL